MSVVVGLSIFDEDSELAIETAFNGFAVLIQDARLLLKIAAFFSGVDVLLETLDWRNPSWFTNEGCDMSCYWLNFGEDLNSGGPWKC